jgi:hypothetical protein
MQIPGTITDNPFAVLSFLAAPAILTNATTLLAMSTSNRLARASDRARAASAIILAQKDGVDEFAGLYQRDFQSATRRAMMLVSALRMFYLSAGCFAAGTCIALFGAFAAKFQYTRLDTTMQILTMTVATVGMFSMVAGALQLVRETRMALKSLDDHHAAITRWRAMHGLAK